MREICNDSDGSVTANGALGAAAAILCIGVHRWHIAVRAALSKRIKRRDVVDGVMACWEMTAGRIHTAAGDQSRGWSAPPMVEEADSDSLSPDPAAPPPYFSPTTRQSGAGGGAETDSDGDEIDLTGGRTEPPDSPTRTSHHHHGKVPN